MSIVDEYNKMLSPEDRLTILGQQTRTPMRRLEAFENPGVAEVVLECDEFTSLCPITGQPDFQTISITYGPQKKCLESKSLKLYLWSFREEGSFCEALANQIAWDIEEAIDARFVEVVIKQKPRGGISIQARAVSRTGMTRPNKLQKPS